MCISVADLKIAEAAKQREQQQKKQAWVAAAAKQQFDQKVEDAAESFIESYIVEEFAEEDWSRAAGQIYLAADRSIQKRLMELKAKREIPRNVSLNAGLHRPASDDDVIPVPKENDEYGCGSYRR